MTNQTGTSGNTLSEKSDEEVARGFWEGEVPGQELMRRLLGRLGLAHRAQEELVRQDGTPVLDETDGQPLTAEDYLVVAERHPRAVESIVGFVLMDPADPDFENARAGMMHVVQKYLPSVEASN
jgi:hypothetical protein